MKKTDMLAEIVKMLAEFELPLTRTGLQEHYLTVPDIAPEATTDVVREAYDWAVAIKLNQYRDWKRVWNENTPEQWAGLELHAFNFEELKILNSLQHKVRVAFTVKKNRPRLFKKGYQDGLRKAIKQRQRAEERIKKAKAGETGEGSN
jgi:hypothetical protein